MNNNVTKIKEILEKLKYGGYGALGSLAVLGAGTVSTVLGFGPALTALVLAPAAVVATPLIAKAVMRDYTKNSMFGVHRDKKDKFKYAVLDENGKAKTDGNGNIVTVTKKVSADNICQKIALSETLDNKFLLSDSSYQSSKEGIVSELKTSLKNPSLTLDQRTEMISSAEKQIQSIKKTVSKLSTKQVSEFYQVQMRNLFMQLRDKQENGEKIQYSFNSHNITIRALKSMCKPSDPSKVVPGKKYLIDSFEQSIGKYKNMRVEKFLFGNSKKDKSSETLDDIRKEYGVAIEKPEEKKQSAPKSDKKIGYVDSKTGKITYRDPRKKDQTEVFDVVFTLTGEKLTKDDINSFVSGLTPGLFYYDEKSNSIKLSREKSTEIKNDSVNTIISSNVSVKNDLPTNITLSHDNHISDLRTKSIEKQESKSKVSTLEQLKALRKIVTSIPSVVNAQHLQNTQELEIQSSKTL